MCILGPPHLFVLPRSRNWVCKNPCVGKGCVCGTCNEVNESLRSGNLPKGQGVVKGRSKCGEKRRAYK